MKYIKRKIFNKLLKYLKTKEIIVIHGARQVGKTTLMRMLADYLQKNNVPPSNIIYMDMEDINYLKLCNSGVNNLINYIKESGIKKNKKVYIFIDEVHYIENVSSFLKLFYDNFSDKYKLIVSGSSSFEIKRKFKDSLVGRFFSFKLNELDFEEFLKFKKKNYNIGKPIKSEIINEELKNLFNEYTLFGGYPRIPFLDDNEIKYNYIKGIINTYIFKDIKDIGGITNIQKFNDLLVHLSFNSGLLNTAGLSRDTGINRNTLSDYIFILENTFVIKRVFPYYDNKNTSIKKMPKIYFEDTGIRRFLMNEMQINNKQFNGTLFENAVFNILKNKYENINYWRNKQKNEVDFIIKKDGKEIKAFEVKKSYSGENISGLNTLKKTHSKIKTHIITLNKNIPDDESKYILLYPWEV